MTQAKTRLNEKRIDRPGKRRHVYFSQETDFAIRSHAAQNFESFSAWVEDACRERLEREAKGESGE